MRMNGDAQGETEMASHADVDRVRQAQEKGSPDSIGLESDEGQKVETT